MASLMNDGPIRMITQGQELTFDFDEKSLYEMGFKDNQVNEKFSNHLTTLCTLI